VRGVDATEALADHGHGLTWLTPNPDADLAEILPAGGPPLLQCPAIFSIIIRELRINLVEWLDLNLGYVDDTNGCFRTVGHNGIVAGMRRLLAFVLQFPKQGARGRLNPLVGKLSDGAG
jgi:hypothetical protein